MVCGQGNNYIPQDASIEYLDIFGELPNLEIHIPACVTHECNPVFDDDRVIGSMC